MHTDTPIPACYHCPRPASGNPEMGWALTCGSSECLGIEGILVAGATYTGRNGERRTIVSLSVPNAREVVYTRNGGKARLTVKAATFREWMAAK